MMHINRAMAAVTAVWALGLASPILGVDGVREINQACAVNTGCFPGDSAGFPVTLSTPGISYILTSDLSRELNPLIAQSVPFVEITADDVTLDLNGFAITCRSDSFELDFCGEARAHAGGAGIFANQDNVTVRNGTVRGMADSGVDVKHNAIIDNVRALNNREHGIDTGSSSIVSRNVVSQNGGHGILANSRSIVQGNVSSLNGGYGLVLFSSPGPGYRENVISSNTEGTVSGGVDTGGNSCDGSTTCP